MLLLSLKNKNRMYHMNAGLCKIKYYLWSNTINGQATVVK